MKIILDTDIGSNIDDTLALCYLLRKCPGEILAVTTVSSHARLRAKLVKWIIDGFAHEIPVVPGREKSLSGEIMANPATIADCLHTEINRYLIGVNPDLPQVYAEAVEKYPGEVILICIGPLTNIAEFIRLYPKHASQLKMIRILAGKLADVPGYHSRVETNARLDPEALQYVLENAGCNIYLFPVNITLGIKADAGKFAEQLSGKSGLGAERIRKQLNCFRSIKKELVLHDPVVAVSAFADIAEYRSVNLTVTTGNGDNAGTTRIRKGRKTAKIFVPRSIDMFQLWQEFNRTFFR